MERIENNNEKRYHRAKQRVEKMKGFYTHASIYAIFVVVFVYLNSFSGSFPWALFPILGWGIGVFCHASDAFEYSIFFGKQWEQRKIKELMQKEEETLQF